MSNTNIATIDSDPSISEHLDDMSEKVSSEVNTEIPNETMTEEEKAEINSHIEDTNNLCPKCGIDITKKENLIIIKSSRKISIPGSRTKYHAITATCKSCGHSLGMAGIVPSETQAYTPKKNAKELHLKKRRAQKQARKQNRRK